MRTKNTEVGFSLISGRHHGPEVWSNTVDYLNREGYPALALDLPIQDDLDLDTHAAILKAAEIASGLPRRIRVAWSWGANVAVRGTESILMTDPVPDTDARSQKLGSSVIERIVCVAPAFHNSTVINHPSYESFPHEHSLLYEAFENRVDEYLEQLYKDDTVREDIRQTFYNGVEDEILVGMIMGGLRLHPRRKEEPVLEHFPDDIPIDCIVFTDDNVTRRETQEKTAAALGAENVIEINGCHGAMIDKSKGHEIGRILISLAENGTAPSRKLHREVFAGHTPRFADL